MVLRPEPGNARTVARLATLGIRARAVPLFTYRALEWMCPTGDFDAVLLTSAAAARLAGDGLHALALPIVVVGEATAAAARKRGLTVVSTGTGDVAAAVARARAAGFARLLHLAGRDHRASGAAATVPVYAADTLTVDTATLHTGPGTVALLHSARAARRLRDLLTEADVPRRDIALAVLSSAVGEAAGGGWRSVVVADTPTDAALCRLLVDE